MADLIRHEVCLLHRDAKRWRELAGNAGDPVISSILRRLADEADLTANALEARQAPET